MTPTLIRTKGTLLHTSTSHHSGQKRSSMLITTYMAAALTLTTTAAFAGTQRIRPAAHPIPNEYIVVLADQTSRNIDSVVDALARQHSGVVLAKLRNGVKAFGVRLSPMEAEALASNPLVDHVEENGAVFLSQASYTVQDFGADQTWWHLDRIDNRGPLYDYHAYAYTSTGNNVNAYVLDTGVLGTHEQFGGRVTTGQTYGDGFPANNPCGGMYNLYEPGHGTAVASVIGGNTNGVAKSVRIVPVKVHNCDPARDTTTSNILWWCWGLDWIIGDAQSFANQGRRAVVNISGGYTVRSISGLCDDTHGNYVSCLDAFENNIRQLVVNGVTVVAAANNFNNAACDTTPARMGYGNPDPRFDFHVITVGGSTEQDQRWVRLPNEMILGDCNPTCIDTGSNYGACVDIYAPAQHFWHLAHIASNSAYRTRIDQISGTSFAAPVVTGMVARLLQAHPTFSPIDIWNYLKTQANQPGCFDTTVSPCNNRLAYISPYE